MENEFSGKFSRLKILHVGWGFVPWRSGGLINYAHDLMEFQADLGWEVNYFCAGRHCLFGQKAALKSWLRNGVRVHEIINSPIIHGGDRGSRSPALEITEPLSERYFIETLEQSRPDLVHIHELAGLPSSLIDIAKERNIPVLMTLADYFLLCPTLKLYDDSGRLCTHDAELSSTCFACSSSAPSRRESVLRTLSYRFKPIAMRLPNWVRVILSSGLSREVLGGAGTEFTDPVYDERRKVNLRRLRRVDVLVARSQKVAYLYKRMLGEESCLEVVNPTLRHIDQIEPRMSKEASLPLRFVTLNGLASEAKGGALLLDAIERLNLLGHGGHYTLDVFGGLAPEYRRRLKHFKNVHYRGPYRPEELNALLDGKDVGIVPSVWEEVFGYVGPEMIAKAIPVIGNDVGGIAEYVREEKTGWINKSNSVGGLVDIMARLIANPGQVSELNNLIFKEKPLRDYRQHFEELMKMYDRAMETRRAFAAVRDCSP